MAYIHSSDHPPSKTQNRVPPGGRRSSSGRPSEQPQAPRYPGSLPESTARPASGSTPLAPWILFRRRRLRPALAHSCSFLLPESSFRQWLWIRAHGDPGRSFIGPEVGPSLPLSRWRVAAGRCRPSTPRLSPTAMLPRAPLAGCSGRRGSLPRTRYPGDT